MAKTIGEEALSQQTTQAATPDVSPQEIQQRLAHIQTEKDKLDYIFHGIAQASGIEFHSRIKAPDTIAAKIAQKRLQGRSYSLDDVNDGYGGRFIIQKEDQKNKVFGLMKKAQDLGLFTIQKAEPVKTGTYEAYHIDFQTPNGIRGEVQIMTPAQQLESVANHSLRARHGENPDPAIRSLRDTQARIAHSLPKNQAMQKASQIQAISAQNGGHSLDPQIIASILKQ